MPDETAPNYDRSKLPETQPQPTTMKANGATQTRGMLESPQLDASGTPTRRAIKDAGQAKEVVENLVSACRTEKTINGRLIAKYNAERPYVTARMEQEGLGWRSNVTTKPHAMMIEKVYPRLSELVNGLKYFTNAELSPKWDGATSKTEAFRKGLTKLCRSRTEWTTFIDDIAIDDSLYGYTVVAWPDEYSWMPKHYRQDEVFLADGCKQLSEFAQVVVLRENFMPHELFEQIKDREAAEAAGWNLKNCILAINTASPTQLRDMMTQSTTTEMWYQNATREMNVGSSYQNGAQVIQTYNLFVREVTGKVSHYRLGTESMCVLYSMDDRFESMKDCLAFYSYQKGNGTMRGSKGVGRDIYELASMIDRMRNEIFDRSILSGKTILQGDPKRVHTFKMSVVGAACIVPAGWTVLEQKFDGNVEPFLRLDAYVQTIVDQLVGSVSMPNAEGEAYRSPEAWKILASRQEEQRDSKLTRFLVQFAGMMQTIQKRACDPETDDKPAKAFQEEMLKVMTREELDELASQPVVSVVRDLTALDRQMISMVCGEKKGNPLYNQRQLEVEDLNARVGADFTRKVLLPEQDPTDQAEQTRLQQMELALITAGQPVPVSVRDNHLVHLTVMYPTLEAIAQAVQAGQTGTAVFEAAVNHVSEHYNQGLSVGVPKDAPIMKQAGDFLKKAGSALQQMKMMDERAAKLQQDTAALAEEDAAGDAEMQQAAAGIAGGGQPAALAM